MAGQCYTASSQSSHDLPTSAWRIALLLGPSLACLEPRGGPYRTTNIGIKEITRCLKITFSNFPEESLELVGHHANREATILRCSVLTAAPASNVEWAWKAPSLVRNFQNRENRLPVAIAQKIDQLPLGPCSAPWLLQFAGGSPAAVACKAPGRSNKQCER